MAETEHGDPGGGTVTIRVNGRDAQVPRDATLLAVVEALDLPSRGLVCEWNGEVIPGAAWASRRVAAGDRLELVRFVGGG